jgi:hypothetical protein
MPHQVVLGHIGCITPINPTSKFGPIPCPMDTLYGNLGVGGATTSKIKKQKQKFNVGLNILDEGYFLSNEGIA